MEKLKSFNLQLFAEEVTNDGEGVVDSPELDPQQEVDLGPELLDPDFPDYDQDPEDEPSEPEDVADPQDSEGQTQSPEENAQFKKMRLKAEEEARAKLQAERAELARMKQEIEDHKREKALRDEYLSSDKVWQKADEEGVSESVAKKLLEAELESKISEEKKKVKERFDFVQNEKKELQKDRFYSQIAPKMEEILAQRPDLNPNTVYYHLKGQMAEELFSKSSKASQQRNIAEMQDSLKRRGNPVGSTGDTSGDTSNLTSEGRAMAEAFGVDPREIADYARKNKIK